MSWQLTSNELVKATGAKYAGPDIILNGVSTDSRDKLNGKLFVALKGERLDAHQFVAAAIQNGATAVMVHKDLPEYSAFKSKAGFFVVGDTLKGLQDLAHYWRVKNKFQVIGISGSNGKTSTKEFLYALIKDFKPTVASKGSFNNHWGVPLSILSAGDDCKVLILEMGMNHLGELKELAKIAQPDIVGVTMVGRSHIGELGSQENVARAKEELYLASPGATAVFNVDNQWTREMYQNSGKTKIHPRRVTFSSHVPGPDVSIRGNNITADGMHINGEIGGVKGFASINVFGRHNIVNLEAAASFAWAAGMPPELIWKKMNGLQVTSWGRNQWLKMPAGTMILFDAYNANPESMAAMLKNLYELETIGKKYLVLGEMLEMGSESSWAHRELGEMAGKIGVEGIWFIGEHHHDFEIGLKSSGFSNLAYFSSQFEPEISDKMKAWLSPQDVVAIKASRGQKLETVVEHWGIKI